MKTQNLKNVQPNMNSRKSSPPSLSCNGTSLRDSMSSSSSSQSYKFRGRSPRRNESRDNISRKSHEIGSGSSREPRITVTSQSTEETDSRSFQSSRRNSHLCTIYEHEMEHEQSSLKETMLKCLGSVSKQISDLKGLVIDCINKIKKLQTKMENAPLQAMEALDIIDDEDSEPIQLPCATMNNFEEFNDLIRLNTEYRNKIKIKIFKSVNKRRSMTRCLGDIIRQFVSANVGKLLVPVKATPGKKIFKNMTIYSLLEGIYTHSFGSKNKPVSTQKFIRALQGVLHNTKDWDGGRKDKETNEKSEEEENAEESSTDFQGSEGD